MAITCAVYAALAWALPLFMTPLVNVLPYVHDKTVLERLPFSIAGSVLVVGALVALNGWRIPPQASISGSKRERLVHWLAVAGGLAMFTYSGAALSANTLGLMAKALPSEAFEAVVVVREADYYGSRYKSVWLEYSHPDGGSTQHLTLSKRLFDYPELKPGDVIYLRGEKTVIGIYINGFSLMKIGLTGHSSGSPTASAQLQR